MVWAYVMENDYGAEKHNNTPIFKLVNQLKIPEEQVVFDRIAAGMNSANFWRVWGRR